MFDTLLCAKKLEEVGVPRDQAEVHIRIMSEIIETNLATKQDLKDLRLATEQDFKDFRLVIQGDIKDLRLDTQSAIERLDHKMIQLENRLVIKLGTIVTIAIAAATTVIKFL